MNDDYKLLESAWDVRERMKAAAPAPQAERHEDYAQFCATVDALVMYDMRDSDRQALRWAKAELGRNHTLPVVGAAPAETAQDEPQFAGVHWSKDMVITQADLDAAGETAGEMTPEQFTQDLEDFRNAPSGVGPLAFTWKDKPHRLIYDLVKRVRETAAYATQRVEQADVDAAELKLTEMREAILAELDFDIGEHTHAEKKIRKIVAGS